MGGDKRSDTKANLLSSIPDYKYILCGPRRQWQLKAAQRGWPIFRHGLPQDDRGGVHVPHSPVAWHTLCPMRSKKRPQGTVRVHVVTPRGCPNARSVANNNRSADNRRANQGTSSLGGARGATQGSGRAFSFATDQPIPPSGNASDTMPTGISSAI